MWKLDSLAFKGVCTFWNRGVRTILQLYNSCARFLYGRKQCHNYIVRACFTNAMHNARTPLGHNLVFFRNQYGIDIFL